MKFRKDFIREFCVTNALEVGAACLHNRNHVHHSLAFKSKRQTELMVS